MQEGRLEGMLERRFEEGEEGEEEKEEVEEISQNPP